MYYSYEKCRIILDEFDNCSTLVSPLVINWNINGKCQNECKYCFSKDYINFPIILSESKLDNIITCIKSLTPLVVVISGGEPLLFPKLEYVLTKIMKFSDVILDTNGMSLDENFITFCKLNKVLLRVSLDDYRTHINDNIRKSSIPNSTKLILNTIDILLKINANFIIHTVLSSDNIDYIIDFGKYLLSLKIKYWEIQVVIPYVGDRNKLKQKLFELQQFSKTVLKQMYIKIHLNDENEKGIILVNPKGEFLTRKTNSLQKEFIDINNKINPELDTLMEVLDTENHFKRYTGEII